MVRIDHPCRIHCLEEAGKPGVGYDLSLAPCALKGRKRLDELPVIAGNEQRRCRVGSIPIEALRIGVLQFKSAAVHHEQDDSRQQSTHMAPAPLRRYKVPAIAVEHELELIVGEPRPILVS